MRPQEPPFALQVEAAEGCSLACSFCALQSIRDNGANAETGTHGKNSAPYRFMKRETARRLASEVVRLAWNPRWEFAMHGEPTMHPDLPGLVREVRTALPKASIMVTSNGSGLLKPERLFDLLHAGINTLVLDDYKHAPGWVAKITELLDMCSVPFTYYPDDLTVSPHARHSGQRIVVICDISDNASGNHQLTNQGGCSFNGLKEPLAERCAKPFRELSVRWDGNVALCCDDWRGEYKIANVLSMPLDDVWNHPHFDAARRRLYAKDRAFGPCKGCDVRTYRNGLLPDKMGKEAMPAPDTASEAHLRAAMRGRVFSIKLGKGD
jgi:radical SAM protein with 4Fe4S-binding SPASM domain